MKPAAGLLPVAPSGLSDKCLTAEEMRLSMNNQNDHDTYIIPPNFVETGTFFGGMFKARNVIEPAGCGERDFQ